MVPTNILLTLVKEKLNRFQNCSNKNSNNERENSTMSMSKIFWKTEIGPLIRSKVELQTDTYRLIGVVTYILEKRFKFKKTNKDQSVWKDFFAIEYTYLDTPFHTSIMADRDVCYICICYCKDLCCYITKKINRNKIPLFTIESEVQDHIVITDLWEILGSMVGDFCLPITENKIRKKDRSLLKMLSGIAGITKIRNDGKKCETHDDIYDTLIQLKSDKELSSKSILFGVIYFSLHDMVSFHDTSNPLENVKNDWPVSRSLDNEVIVLLHKTELINVSIVHNNMEYFLVMSSFTDDEKYYIKKFLPTLIPTLIEEDKEADILRIGAIELGLLDFSTSFLKKLVLNKLKSDTSSSRTMTSNESSSSSSSSSSSRNG